MQNLAPLQIALLWILSDISAAYAHGCVCDQSWAVDDGPTSFQQQRQQIPYTHGPSVYQEICISVSQHVLLAVQGWGQLANLGVLMVGLLAFNSKGSGPYSHGAAGATYRFSFGCIAVLIAWMAYYRTWRMKPVAGSKTKPVQQADKVSAASTQTTWDASQVSDLAKLRASSCCAAISGVCTL